jgi:hypothetical protein
VLSLEPGGTPMVADDDRLDAIAHAFAAVIDAKQPSSPTGTPRTLLAMQNGSQKRWALIEHFNATCCAPDCCMTSGSLECPNRNS